MKLSKSKLALAKVINENGGWPDEVNYAVQQGAGEVWTSRHKPIWIVGGFRFSIDYCFHIANCKLINNRHQAILSREEYYQAYPKDDADGISLSELMSRKSKAVKADADGWIEWSGVECPVEAGTIVDVRYRDGRENFHVKAMSYDSTGSIKSLSATCWGSINSGSDIVAYRLHKPEVKPELCESVTRSIPDLEETEAHSCTKSNPCGGCPDCGPVMGDATYNEMFGEAKPTIEQLAQDYRNAKDYAVLLQKEAGDAAKVADAKLGALERAGEALGLIIAVVSPIHHPSIDTYQDLMIGDVIEITSVHARDNSPYGDVIGCAAKVTFVGDPSHQMLMVKPDCSERELLIDGFKFISRP